MNSNVYVDVPGEHRNEYLRVEQALKRYGMDPNKFTIQEADLRLEAELSASKDAYQFNLYETAGAQRPQELRLNRNDMFFVRGMAVCLTKQDKTAGNYGNYPLFTYPDTNFFPGDNGTDLPEHAALELVYSGVTSFLTDPVTRIQNYMNFNFRYVPRRVYELPTGEDNPNNPNYPQYGPYDEYRGFFMFSYMPAIYGNMNNRLSLEIGTGDKTLIAGGIDADGEPVDTSNVLCVLLKGYKVLNGAEAAGQWTAV